MSHEVNRWKNILLVPALGALLLGGGAASTWSCDNCDQRIHKAEENLRKAIDRHGEHSSQAEQRRRELEETKRSCGR
jgi:hypothetical protein